MCLAGLRKFDYPALQLPYLKFINEFIFLVYQSHLMFLVSYLLYPSSDLICSFKFIIG